MWFQMSAKRWGNLHHPICTFSKSSLNWVYFFREKSYKAGLGKPPTGSGKAQKVEDCTGDVVQKIKKEKEKHKKAQYRGLNYPSNLALLIF